MNHKYGIIVLMISNFESSPNPRSPGSINLENLPHQLQGNVILTSPRFSLAHPELDKRAVDVVSKSEINHINHFVRFLIVGDELFDEAIWSKLDSNNIPQLPVVGHENGLRLMGVKDGLKPLAHEALFDLESTDTYIGDPEIYYSLGRLFRRVFNATGTILIDAETGKDSPQDHVAISNFSDNGEYLFVYPPYKVSESSSNLNINQAIELFSHSLKSRLDRNVSTQHSLREVADRLYDAAITGFTQEDPQKTKQ
jgi:hypothetical protein